MKKIMAAIVISAFVIVLGGTTAFAVGRGRQEAPAGTAGNKQYSTDYACQGTGRYFIDENGDNICDYRNTAENTGECPYHEDHSSGYRYHAGCSGNSAGCGRSCGHHGVSW